MEGRGSFGLTRSNWEGDDHDHDIHKHHVHLILQETSKKCHKKFIDLVLFDKMIFAAIKSGRMSVGESSGLSKRPVANKKKEREVNALAMPTHPNRASVKCPILTTKVCPTLALL